MIELTCDECGDMLHAVYTRQLKYYKRDISTGIYAQVYNLTLNYRKSKRIVYIHDRIGD